MKLRMLFAVLLCMFLPLPSCGRNSAGSPTLPTAAEPAMLVSGDPFLDAALAKVKELLKSKD